MKGYRVADEGLAFACDCPVGGDRVLCKHVVATALAYLDEYGPGRTQPDKAKGRKAETTLADVQHYLESLEAGALVELVMDRLDHDDDWRAALLRTAAMHRPDGVDLDALKKSVTAATRTGPFLDYRESIGFASGLSSLCDSLAELIDAGHADAAIGLIEYALKRCEGALDRMDDSSGCMSEVFDSLQTHHLRACQLDERHSPKKLAKRLFDWQMATGYDTFYNAPETYAEVLGEDGLARFRELVKKRWDTLPDRQPGDDRIHFDRDRFRLQSMMESLARANGDMDELILIKQKDLSSPYGFHQIAALCQEGVRRRHRSTRTRLHRHPQGPVRPERRNGFLRRPRRRHEPRGPQRHALLGEQRQHRRLRLRAVIVEPDGLVLPPPINPGSGFQEGVSTSQSNWARSRRHDSYTEPSHWTATGPSTCSASSASATSR